MGATPVDNVIIRELDTQDRESFYRVRLHGLIHHPRSFWETTEEFKAKSPEEHHKYLAEIQGSADKFILGAFEDGELIGTVGCSRETGIKGYHRGMIWGMYVRTDRQGKGLGSVLLKEAIDRARKMHMEVLFLFVAPENAPARQLYISCGFQTYGIEPYSMKADGKFFSEEMMYLKL